MRDGAERTLVRVRAEVRVFGLGSGLELGLVSVRVRASVRVRRVTSPVFCWWIVVISTGP